MYRGMSSNRRCLESVVILLQVLESLKNWPLLTKNKVEDSKIEEPVRECVKSDNERLRTLAEEVSGVWYLRYITDNSVTVISSLELAGGRLPDT